MSLSPPAAAVLVVLAALALAGCGERSGAPSSSAAPAAASTAPAAGSSGNDGHRDHGGADALARIYPAALDLVASPDCLRQDQDAWEAATAQACAGDATCTATARSARADQLAGLLPGAALDAHDEVAVPVVLPVLLAVAGGEPDPEAGAGLPDPVEIRGRPLETEGGYALAGPDFDAAAWEDFEALLGDEEALAARFGDGPVVIRGLAGSFPAMGLQDRGLAAIDAVVAGGGELLVRGAAVPEPEAPPALDPRACLYVYAVPD